MTDEQILAIPHKLSTLNISGTILLQWHGGEPTLASSKRVKNLINLLNKTGLLLNQNFIHGIQTNLVRIERYNTDEKDAWFSLLNTHFDHKYIGVSWDKDIRESKSDIFERDFLSGLSSLRDAFNNPTFSPALTITAAKPFIQWIQKNPKELITWLQDNNLHRLHIEKLTPSGTALGNWDTVGVTNKEYSNAMSRLYITYKHLKTITPDLPLHISPFDDLVIALKTSIQNNVCYAGGCTTSMHTFSSAGYDNRCTEITGQVSVDNTEYKAAHCYKCNFNNICNGGCPTANTNNIDQSNECTGSKSLLELISSSL